MKFVQLISLLSICVVCANNVSAQSKMDTTTAISIINKAIVALGGEDYLRTVKTLYTDVSTEMEGRQVHCITREMLPNKGSFQIVYNDRIVFENWFNGTKGFEKNNGVKKEAAPDEFKDKLYRKNIFNDLDYLDTTLYKLELLGIDNVGDDLCYKIKAVMIDGPVTKILYYSKATFYLLMEDKLSSGENSKTDRVLFYGYKKVGKLTYYDEFKMITGNGSQTGKIVNLSINSMITDKDFNK